MTDRIRGKNLKTGQFESLASAALIEELELKEVAEEILATFKFTK